MTRLLALFCLFVLTVPASATVLVQEDFESYAPGTRLVDIPGWFATTFAFTVGNQVHFAAGGSQYIAAPSRTGAGDRTRFGYFDASTAYNARPSGQDTVVATVKMFIPNMTESTYGGMEIFDQSGHFLAVIGVDMMVGKTLTSATTNVNNIAVNLNQYNDLGFVANFDTGLIDYLFNGTNIGSTLMSAANLSAGFGDFDFYNNGFNAVNSVPFRYDNYLVQTVPEPNTILLFGAGLGGALAVRRRRAESNREKR